MMLYTHKKMGKLRGGVYGSMFMCVYDEFNVLLLCGGGVRFLWFFMFQTIFLFFLLLLYYFLRHFSQTLSAHIVVCDVIYAAAYNDVVIVLTGRPLYHRMVFSFGFLRLPPLSLSFSLSVFLAYAHSVCLISVTAFYK